MHHLRISPSLSPQIVNVKLLKRPITHQQVRHATLIRRPKRPYTFTQLVTLSDGSSYLQRTTSPKAVYVSAKDARNSAMWNPSSHKLTNVEEDEAGKLRIFRERFGRGWDAESSSLEAASTESQLDAANNGSLLDLISAANDGFKHENNNNARTGSLEARKEEERGKSTKQIK